ncbi:XF1762 family protein [Streptomyces sp. ISL-11]|uniref:XF1762 family protein n=1 Tax=Streptomyces sp. ISL-11 TaxID=2819174 RepID=UPI0035B346F9
MSEPADNLRLALAPVRFREAAEFVRLWHRHHRPPPGQVFAIGAEDQGGVLHAVAIVGRPVARHLDDGRTLLVQRDVPKGACTSLSKTTTSLIRGL